MVCRVEKTWSGHTVDIAKMRDQVGMLIPPEDGRPWFFCRCPYCRNALFVRDIRDRRLHWCHFPDESCHPHGWNDVHVSRRPANSNAQFQGAADQPQINTTNVIDPIPPAQPREDRATTEGADRPDGLTRTVPERSKARGPVGDNEDGLTATPLQKSPESPRPLGMTNESSFELMRSRSNTMKSTGPGSNLTSNFVGRQDKDFDRSERSTEETCIPNIETVTPLRVSRPAIAAVVLLAIGLGILGWVWIPRAGSPTIESARPSDAKGACTVLQHCLERLTARRSELVAEWAEITDETQCRHLLKRLEVLCPE
jgi:hypothetical protein